MSTQTRKAYVYQMKLVPANVLGIIIFIILGIISFLLKVDYYTNINFFVFIILMLLYLALHEFIHGIGYLIGGTKRKNITYGICLEKGIFYCMAYQEISKKNILISLILPFLSIGVITYIIGWLLHIPILVLLSIINLVGASMDLVMFKYILGIKDIIYSESGSPDEFVLISNEDLTKKKSLFLEIKNIKDYKKEDYIFKDIKKITISKTSYIIIGILLIIGIISLI